MISLDQIRLDQKYKIRRIRLGQIRLDQVDQIRLDWNKNYYRIGRLDQIRLDRLDQIDQIRLVLVRLESDLIRQIRLDQNQITYLDRLGQIRQIRLGQVDQIRLKLDSIRQSR